MGEREKNERMGKEKKKKKEQRFVSRQQIKFNGVGSLEI